MRIVDSSTGLLVSDEITSLPLDVETALAWCVAHDVSIEFNRYIGGHPYVRIDCNGLVAVRPTFVEVVGELQRLMGELL